MENNMNDKITETTTKISNTINQVENKINQVKENQYVRQGVDMLNALSAINDQESCIAFVRKYKVWTGNMSAVNAEIKNRGIKLKQKRRFGFVTIGAWFKGGMSTRDAWLRTTTTIDNTIWKSLNFNSLGIKNTGQCAFWATEEAILPTIFSKAFPR